ncbi:MAG: dethiobiotin synthase [Rhodospirillaceae bacterium]|nr:dethiobiotin synthase [Rhodospirillaceae bacterium]
MKQFFVTATGTGVGKTVVTARFIRELSAAGKTVNAIKPVITGFTWHALQYSDTGRLLSALDLKPEFENVKALSPWRFEEPLSPDMAASREDRAVDFDELIEFCRDTMANGGDVGLIEGVGGVMVPMDKTHTVADWITTLDIPCIVVVGSYLGTLSHTLTTVEAMRARGLEIATLVVSESEDSPVPLEETVDTIRRFLPDIDLRSLPRGKYSPDQPELLVDLAT